MTVQEESSTSAPQRSDRRLSAIEERRQAVFQPVGEVDLKELLRKLGRGKWLILGTVIAVLSLAAIVLTQLTPRYIATAAVVIGSPPSNIADLEAIVSGFPADIASLETEIEIIGSRTLANKTIERLELNRDTEFNVALRPESRFKTILKDLRVYMAAVFPSAFVDKGPPQRKNKELSEDRETKGERARIIDSFLPKLKVAVKGRSRVITISFESERRRTAASAANALADLYIVASLEAKFGSTR